MNRGSNAKRVKRGIAQKGFNEAPIHESGKFVHVVSSRRFGRCFNEAPIHESGK